MTRITERRNAGAALRAACAALVACQADAQVTFIDVAALRGLDSYRADEMGGGVAAADYDQDGDIDIFVPNGSEDGSGDGSGNATALNQLFRNRGDGFFEDVAPSAGLAAQVPSRAALWLDIDGDHDLDLLVAGDGFETPSEGQARLMLYRQVTPAHFVDATQEAGLAVMLTDGIGQHVGGLCAGDLDQDGDLDLFLSMWSGACRLFWNDGDGSFTPAIDTPEAAVKRHHWQPIVHDFNADGWLDLYIAVDFNTPNQLWINTGNGRFVERGGAAGLDNAMNDMGIAVADYDNDADFDFFVTNILTGQRHNVLYRNDSDPQQQLHFAEVAAASGVAAAGWAWGATFLDADKDGWLDLAVTNGFRNVTRDRSCFFRNLGGPTLRFSNDSESAGFDDTYWGSSLIAFDADRDGDVDLLQTCLDGGGLLRLLENTTETRNNYLVVQPRMQGPNTQAIGAVVRVSAGGLSMSRTISAGGSFLGQEPAEAFFGIGHATLAEAVHIVWPDGTQTTLHDVVANQAIVVEHRQPRASAPIRLLPAAPNPFSQQTELGFWLEHPGAARLRVLDVTGREVWSRTLAPAVAGAHQLMWPARDGAGRALPSGAYIVCVEALHRRAARRIVLVR